MKTRQRRWQAPALAAGTLTHSASNPISARSARTAPSARIADSGSVSPMHHGHGSTSLSARSLKSSLTFSMTTSGGRNSAMARATKCQTPLRLPFRSPALRPAHEMSVQGNPAVSTSTGSTADQSTTSRSPRLGTPGKRQARIADLPGSLSATHATSPPRTSVTARPMPAYPAQSSPIRSVMQHHPPMPQAAACGSLRARTGSRRSGQLCGCSDPHGAAGRHGERTSQPSPACATRHRTAPWNQQEARRSYRSRSPLVLVPVPGPARQSVWQGPPRRSPGQAAPPPPVHGLAAGRNCRRTPERRQRGPARPAGRHREAPRGPERSQRGLRGPGCES